jgi:flagellar basal-body rod protein FlgG
VTARGELVLDQAGRPIAAAANGTVDPRGIGVFALNNPRKEGDSLVSGNPAGAGAGTVRSGALESSGADAAQSMVDMIESMRAFEAGQKVIQAIDETLGKAATSVGAVSGS